MWVEHLLEQVLSWATTATKCWWLLFYDGSACSRTSREEHFAELDCDWLFSTGQEFLDVFGL